MLSFLKTNPTLNQNNKDNINICKECIYDPAGVKVNLKVEESSLFTFKEFYLYLLLELEYYEWFLDFIISH